MSQDYIDGLEKQNEELLNRLAIAEAERREELAIKFNKVDLPGNKFAYKILLGKFQIGSIWCDDNKSNMWSGRIQIGIDNPPFSISNRYSVREVITYIKEYLTGQKQFVVDMKFYTNITRQYPTPVMIANP